MAARHRGGALALAGWGLSRLAPPPPPKTIVMSTGAPDGAYPAYATRYREIIAEYGVDVVLKPSRGAQENLERLRSGTDGVEVALVQSGLTRAEEPGLASLGSVFYEPIWVFYRDKRVLERTFELAGRKIAIGAPGSGTSELGRALPPTRWQPVRSTPPSLYPRWTARRWPGCWPRAMCA